MGFSSIKSLVDQFWLGGKEHTTYFMKQTGAAAYTAGRYYDLTMLVGNPRPNVYPGSMGEATPINSYDSSSRKTSLWHQGRPTAPATKHILTAQAYTASSTGNLSVLTLCDMLLYYPLIDLDDDTRQTLINTNVLTRYTDGKGVRAYLVCTADTGAVSPTLWYEYTNQSDEIKCHSTRVDLTASSIAGQIVHSGVLANTAAPFLPLAPGDTGMKTIRAVQLSTGMGGGWGCIVLVKPLLNIPIVVASVPVERDYLMQTPSLPRVYDDAYLGFIMFAGQNVAASSQIYGSVTFVWGTP